MSKSLAFDAQQCAEALKKKFPLFEEYTPENGAGESVNLRIPNENPVSSPIFVTISQQGGITMRFGDLVLCCGARELSDNLLSKIDLVLSDRLVALVNYRTMGYLKRGVSNFYSSFVINDSEEFDDEKKRLRDMRIRLRSNLSGLRKFTDKYRGVTVLYNWSGSLFEKFER